jgi:hypothetical protein
VSNINQEPINENFPVPGQDNDTAVFRSNFDTIKTSLRIARDEITDLENNTARTDTNNDFNLNILGNAILETTRLQKWDYGQVQGAVSIEFGKGHYQILRISGSNANLEFKEFPGDPELSGNTSLIGVGVVRLEIYGDNVVRTITFNQPNGTVVKRSGFPGAIFTVSSQDDPVVIEVWRHNQNTILVRFLGQYT